MAIVKCFFDRKLPAFERKLPLSFGGFYILLNKK